MISNFSQEAALRTALPWPVGCAKLPANTFLHKVNQRDAGLAQWPSWKPRLKLPATNCVCDERTRHLLSSQGVVFHHTSAAHGWFCTLSMWRHGYPQTHADSKLYMDQAGRRSKRKTVCWWTAVGSTEAHPTSPTRHDFELRRVATLLGQMTTQDIRPKRAAKDRRESAGSLGNA